MEELELQVHASTDRGRKRSSNEDAFGVWIPEESTERARRGVLLVLADGMGGMQAGEVASRLAVESVLREFRAASGDEDPGETLRRAVERANHDVWSAGRSSAAWQGMGTTCTAMAIRGREAWIAHVGDSRAYLLRGGEAHVLTEDHSLVASLVRQHELTAEQARTDVRRALVIRSIGARETVEVDSGRIEARLDSDDTLILCSDGLHGLVLDGEIAAAAQAVEGEGLCENLIALANARGGHDNITVVAARALRATR